MKTLMTFVAVAGLVSVAGCDGTIPGANLNRMIRQQKAKLWTTSEYFEDGRAVRPIPDGTIAWHADIDHPALTTGEVDGKYVEQYPVEVNAPLLARGRDRFNIYCATCHGVRADGDSEVSHNMELRKPPSLIDDKRRAYPPGRIFSIATLGYGIMPAYGNELSTNDRWAIVAYLQALQLSQSAKLDSLPAALRKEAEEALH